MKAPTTRTDLQYFVDNSIQEGIQLEYKDSRKVNHKERHDIAKEVSAFANSDGGLLIFGIQEDGHVPVALDSGVDHAQFTREWLENLIISNIAPRIPDLEVTQIPLSSTHSAYAVRVGRSVRGPHQERHSKRYYRRYNFTSVPMEDYEIADVRIRRLAVLPLIQFEVEVRNAFLVYFVIRNSGQAVAKDVRFQFSPDLNWRGNPPPLIGKGVKYFPAGREFRIRYHSFPDLLAEGSELVRTFDSTITYMHDGTGEIVREELHVDLGDYLGTSPPADNAVSEFKELRKELERIRTEIRRLSETLHEVGRLAGPTGLALSVTTIRTLGSLLGREVPVLKISPRGCSPSVFIEILGVGDEIANRLSGHFWGTSSMAGLQEVTGMDGTLLERIRDAFLVDDASQ